MRALDSGRLSPDEGPPAWRRHSLLTGGVRRPGWEDGCGESPVQGAERRWKSRRDSEHMHLNLHRRAGQLRKVKGRALRDACSSPAMAEGRCWQS
ncbi:hypothetical protein BN1708_007713 [Verticillium longisporum]|uniref:Uncharacterized protein n=1 Tax=Verticillium longisporum TaxID=100787 RepID=A0A0G4MVV4_VERLO|nr:hypothetical protein BN1708_007713 [Verticillium longisporum]